MIEDPMYKREQKGVGIARSVHLSQKMNREQKARRKEEREDG